jgi:uncharacterized membrane protein
MIDELLFILTLASAVGCGLCAGVFFAFSAFVMKALSRLPASQGIAAMQAINVAAVAPLFMVPLFGTAAACVLVALSLLLVSHQPGATCTVVGSLLYLIGAIVVTIVFNVPRNKALASVAPASIDGAALWAGYVRSWTAWNHVRTAAALGAATFLTIALCLQRAGGAA